ncbi:MAG: UDP-phosphate galactose phosphotransferase [Candidatus Saccharibacteria bacterium]|nr:UDP-phosphate galactose phosphotransferase [Candidatus Saccharibacteria bacterium]
MKKGLEYAFSPEKRALDLAVAVCARPAASAAGALLCRMTHRELAEDDESIFNQERIGVDGAPFIIDKLRTLDSRTGEPFGVIAQLFRQYGIDELMQSKNILHNQMSVVGHRPLPPYEHGAVLANASPALVGRWERVVLPTKPGAISTFSLLNHREPEFMIDRAEYKLECDIKDVIDGSLACDVSLLARTLGAIAGGSM